MADVLRPYPLCEICVKTNGGLLSVHHRQSHVRAHGQESCVDSALAGLIVHLWEVCETRSCCENDGGLAYVVVTSQTQAAAVDLLDRLGLEPTIERGFIRFQVSRVVRLDDAESVRRALHAGSTTITRPRVDGSGTFHMRWEDR